MHIVGIDLAGPAGRRNTGVAVFKASGNQLSFEAGDCDGSDESIHALVAELLERGSVVVGVDAPLSYQPGGGQRPRDAELRRLVVSRGMRPGSVMAPTAPRMVYLTLRGIALAGALERVFATALLHVVEVHPGATLCLRGAALEAVNTFARIGRVRPQLLAWLASHGLARITAPAQCSSHFVAACAAALAAWDWHKGTSPWVAKAQVPWHPYDFAC